MDYKPATALITSTRSNNHAVEPDQPMLVAPEDIPGLLTQIANLVSKRASRLVQRQLRQSHLAVTG
jgi:hypothetical protein